MAETSVTAFLRRIGQALFREDDSFARRRGWQIEVGAFGLSRTYRYPGFELLARCRECGGSRRCQGADGGRCAVSGGRCWASPPLTGGGDTNEHCP